MFLYICIKIYSLNFFFVALSSVTGVSFRVRNSELVLFLSLALSPTFSPRVFPYVAAWHLLHDLFIHPVLFRWTFVCLLPS